MRRTSLQPASLWVVACAACTAEAMLLNLPMLEPAPDVHGPIPSTSRRSMTPFAARSIPQGKKVAIILRGETFRYQVAWGAKEGKGVILELRSCAAEARKVQLNCTHSLIEKVIEPLERQGNRVEIVFTSVRPNEYNNSAMTSNVEDCPLDNLIFSALAANSTRMVKRESFVTASQADTMLKVVGSLNDQYGGARAVSAEFDYIMIVRNDMYWKMDIMQTQADFDKINVLSRCKGSVDCVYDTFWMVPGPLYAAFTSSLGHDRCFQRLPGHGHDCQKPIKNALEKIGHVGAFGWLEDTLLPVRAPQQVADLFQASVTRRSHNIRT